MRVPSLNRSPESRLSSQGRKASKALLTQRSQSSLPSLGSHAVNISNYVPSDRKDQERGNNYDFNLNIDLHNKDSMMPNLPNDIIRRDGS